MHHRPRVVAEWLQQRRRLVLYLLSFVVIIALQTALYWWGMRTFEGDPRSLFDSFGIVVQSLTTTGYGQDAPWNSVFMSTLVIVMQFTGVAYLFVAFPLFVVPWLREAIHEPRAPEAVAALSDHVVLLGHSPIFSTLVNDLGEQDADFVVVDGDEDQARELYERGLPVVCADTDDVETLTDVNVPEARSVVIDARDNQGIDAVLTVREITEDAEIVCLVEDPGRSQYLRYAGATTILSPKHRLGKAVADKVRHVVRNDQSVEDLAIDVADFPVGSESSLHGQALSDIDAVDETGATLVGAWVRGQFVPRHSGDHVVDHNTVLVVAGTDDQFERVEGVTNSSARALREGPVIVAGHGIVGKTADGILQKAGYETTTVDVEERDGIDVVGDIADPETLPAAGVDDAATVVVALSDDDAAIRATLVASQRHDVDVVAAADADASVSKLYRAGADYALALPRLAGRMVMAELFDTRSLPLQQEVRLAAVDATGFAGRHPSSLVDGSDVVLIAVQRNGSLLDDVGDHVEISPDDEVIVAGPAEAVDAFCRKKAA